MTRDGALRVMLLGSVLLSSALVGALGCSGDGTNPTTGTVGQSASQTYWALQLNQHAINMATVVSYNTIQLTATPRNPSGVALTGLGRPAFHVGDSTVTVDSTGLLTAHYHTLGSPTQVIASLTAQGYTLADTAYIQVTDTVPQHPLTTFSLQPAVGDSAKRATQSEISVTWPVMASTAAGVVCNAVQCPLQVYYTSSNPLIAQIDRQNGQVSMNQLGHVVFTATTWAYGVALQDTVTFTCGYPIAPFLSVNSPDHTILSAGQEGVYPSPVMILGVGAVVTWGNFAEPPHGSFLGIPGVAVAVTFVNPANVDTASQLIGWGDPIGPPTGSGDIPTFGADTINYDDYRARSFPVRGTYRWYTSIAPADTFIIMIQPGP